MISTYHPNPKAKLFCLSSKTPAEKRGISQIEYERRCSRVKHLAINCPYKEGELVVDSLNKTYKVLNIVDDYNKLPLNEVWRDNPFIVTLGCTKTNNICHATVNYVVPSNVKITC
jgi:hypothetical protein